MIRRLWKTLKLGFDRSFSGASWKQITWLFGILALVLGFSLWIKSYCTAELHDMRILELLLDPGSFRMAIRWVMNACRCWRSPSSARSSSPED